MHTHARRIVQGFVHRQLSLIHTARRELLCAAVSAVMVGHLLDLQGRKGAIQEQRDARQAWSFARERVVLSLGQDRQHRQR